MLFVKYAELKDSFSKTQRRISQKTNDLVIKDPKSSSRVSSLYNIVNIVILMKHFHTISDGSSGGGGFFLLFFLTVVLGYQHLFPKCRHRLYFFWRIRSFCWRITASQRGAKQDAFIIFLHSD